MGGEGGATLTEKLGCCSGWALTGLCWTESSSPSGPEKEKEGTPLDSNFAGSFASPTAPSSMAMTGTGGASCLSTNGATGGLCGLCRRRLGSGGRALDVDGVGVVGGDAGEGGPVYLAGGLEEWSGTGGGGVSWEMLGG